MIGQRLGPYVVTAKLGEGGMGEVWRATDSRLKREVAIKVLPAGFTADGERLARFEREAQLLAQLHHSNIASIFGLEESGGVRALVMELVEGPTLAERLAQGALPLEEALAIARQIAEALEAAHEKGIVHRDLKPQNVKVARDGTVKVLDFGLAKATGSTADEASASDLASPTMLNSPTLTAAGTQLGVILGTAAYMSPEQAKGQPIDRRADIWAFGVVLREMLTGTRLFEGPTVAETLALVLTRPPDLARLPPATPVAIRRLLARCLERRTRDRLRDIGEARVALAEAQEEMLAPPAEIAAASGARGFARSGWLVAALLAAALVALLVLRPWTASPAPGLLRFTISSASGALILPGSGNSSISPDGRHVAFVGSDAAGRQGLWIQDLDQVRARLLAGTEGASYPFWSPDSRTVGFFARSALRKVSIADGRLETLCDASEGRGASWGRGGTIVFAPRVTGPLYAVPESGGAAKAVTRVEGSAGETSHRFPSFLPDGKRFVYIADPGANSEEGQVFLASLDGAESRALFRSRRAPIYAPPGYLIYSEGDNLVARPFDAKSGELGGEPRRLEERTPGIVNTQDRSASASDSGVLLVPSVESAGTRVVWLDRRGRRLSDIPLPKEAFVGPRLSPDGRRLALHTEDPGELEGEIWMIDLASEQASRLTFSPGLDRYPVWSPDGSELVFQAKRGRALDLWRRPATEGGAERELFSSPVAWKQARSWVGDWLAFETVERESGFDIHLLAPGRPDEPPIRLLSSPASEVGAAISPDGRWLAFASNESGRQEIYVVSIPDAKVKYQVTTAGGQQPVWRRDGTELFYIAADNAVTAIPVSLRPTLTVGKPTTLFSKLIFSWSSASNLVSFDVSADGSRIVLLEPEDEGRQTLIVVSDWQRELAAGREP